jgi:hypothetical protein
MGYCINWIQTRSFSDSEWYQICQQLNFLSYRYGVKMFQSRVMTEGDNLTESLFIDAGGYDLEEDISYQSFELQKELLKNPYNITPEDQEGNAVGRLIFLDKKGEYYDFHFDPVRKTRWTSIKTSRGVYGLICWELLKFVQFVAAGALMDVRCDGLDGIYGDEVHNPASMLKEIAGSRNI